MTSWVSLNVFVWAAQVIALFVPKMHVGHVVTMSIPFKPSAPVNGAVRACMRVCVCVCLCVCQCVFMCPSAHVCVCLRLCEAHCRGLIYHSSAQAARHGNQVS